MEDLSSHFNEKAKELIKNKKFEEAIKLTDRAIEVKQEQESDDFWYKRAVQLCELGDFEEAVVCVDKDLTLHEKSYESFFLKGLLLYRLEDYAESVECFNKAAEERNQKFLKNTKKVDHMKKARKFEKALLYSDFAKNKPSLDNTFWYSKGLSLVKLQKFEDASSCFQNALENNPNDSKILYDLAKCEFLAGNQEDCFNLLEKSSQLDSACKEKLLIDKDFFPLNKNKKFRAIAGL